ncbi:MAG: restriction endonuclease subunit S [Clostridiales bacterium]|nr:restriction endonuclease subunit S [Clostridiales bacterium]
MIKAKLKNICNILNGYAFKSNNYVNDGIRIIRITNVQKGIIEDSDPKFYPNEEEKKIQKYLLNENDLLISLTGNVGRVGLLRKDLLPAALNQRVGCIRIKDKNKLNIRYLFQLLNSNTFENICISNSKGIAQKNLSTEWLKEYEFIIPNMEEQLIIAEKLENIQKIITIKQSQLCKLDELIKSLFVDMFNKYEKIELHFIANIVMGQSPKSSSYNNNNIGTPFFQGKADYGDKYTIIKHWTTKPCKLAQKGNVLMSVRAPVGPVNIASHNCCIGRGLCAINSKPEKANNEFLYNALKAIQNEISSIGTGSTFKAITKNEIYNIKLPNAPIEKQDEFTKIVNQIDKQKFEIQKKKQVHIKIGG